MKVDTRTATDVGQTRNTQRSRVTSDPTKGNQTTAVLGPWVDVPGAQSPFTFTPAAAQPVLFGRIKL